MDTVVQAFVELHVRGDELERREASEECDERTEAQLSAQSLALDAL